ncbi:MAG: hypothetical protein KDE05_12300, partial [Parvularculaceae bacterium]|nr:hypothetical protein [Parvularculaceae bacterium]
MFIRSAILVAVSACAVASCKSTGKAGPAVATPLASKTAITCDVYTAYAAIDSLLTRTIALRRGYEALSRSNPAHPLLIISAPSVDSAIVRLAEILRPFRAGLVERCDAAARCSGAASDCRALGDGLVAFEEEMTRDRYIWLADKSFEAYGENLAKMEAILAKGPDGVGFIDLQESDEAAANLSDSIERLYTEGDVARPDRCYAPAAANASEAAQLLIPASMQGEPVAPSAEFRWPAPPIDADVEIERALFVEKFGFSQAQFDENVGFVLFDMKNDRIMRSHNSDRLFPLASVTKLFTMLAVAETFETIQEWARRDLAF